MVQLDPATADDVRIVSQQLGRPARNVVGIAARCVCGAPTVVSTSPRLDDGTPFPTFYYLTHPAATAAVSTLEAEGRMPHLAALLVQGDDADALAAQYRAAHLAYLADREAVAVVDGDRRHLGRRHARSGEVPARARRPRARRRTRREPDRRSRARRGDVEPRGVRVHARSRRPSA